MRELLEVERMARSLVEDLEGPASAASHECDECGSFSADDLLPDGPDGMPLSARLRELRLVLVQLDQARAREVSP